MGSVTQVRYIEPRVAAYCPSLTIRSQQQLLWKSLPLITNCAGHLPPPFSFHEVEVQSWTRKYCVEGYFRPRPTGSHCLWWLLHGLSINLEVF